MNTDSSSQGQSVFLRVGVRGLKTYSESGGLWTFIEEGSGQGLTLLKESSAVAAVPHAALQLGDKASR